MPVIKVCLVGLVGWSEGVLSVLKGCVERGSQEGQK